MKKMMMALLLIGPQAFAANYVGVLVTNLTGVELSHVFIEAIPSVGATLVNAPPLLFSNMAPNAQEQGSFAFKVKTATATAKFKVSFNNGMPVFCMGAGKTTPADFPLKYTGIRLNFNGPSSTPTCEVVDN